MKAWPVRGAEGAGEPGTDIWKLLLLQIDAAKLLSEVESVSQVYL